jgi:hypothetical protein
MKLPALLTGVVSFVTTGFLIGDTQPPTPKGDPRAAALLQEGAKTRYTWSPHVQAVSGKVAWEEEGKSGSAAFRSVLHQRGGLTFSGADHAVVPDSVREHIASMIGHRAPPKAGAGTRSQPPSVIVVEDEDRGPLILTVGDPLQSTERVKDGKLVQVNRVMGGKRFTIDVMQFEPAPDGHRFYPAAFTVTWWDAVSGKKVEKQYYTTAGFYVVDGQMFPKGEKVVSDKNSKTSTLEIKYSDIHFETSQPGTAEK